MSSAIKKSGYKSTRRPRVKVSTTEILDREKNFKIHHNGKRLTFDQPLLSRTPPKRSRRKSKTFSTTTFRSPRHDDQVAKSEDLDESAWSDSISQEVELSEIKAQEYERREIQAGRIPDPVLLQRLRNGQDLYPNCHVEIWLRSCKAEVERPLSGKVKGVVPSWIKGTLIRNGAGNYEVGTDRFQHLFDGSALLHRFGINGGKVTYQCRFLRTNTWKRNMAARRIVVTEFGTRAVPDPCQTIFNRIAAIFRPGESLSDNAMISVYPIGDEFYAFTESPIMTRFNPLTLETTGRVNMSKHVSIVNHTSHPLVLNDGSVVNLGLTVGARGPRYTIVQFPSKARYKLSFIIGNDLHLEDITHDLGTLIHLVSRLTGKHTHTFKATAFFFLHVINTFDRPSRGGGEEVVLDICCYKNPAMLSCMYTDALKSAQSNPDYARLFRGRPQRFVLPLMRNGVQVRPRQLSSLGCETPRINANLLGRPYRYFYAISSDVDHENPGTLIKVDTWTSTCQTWGEAGLYPSEPIFVPSPGAQREDDGVVLCALVWAHDEYRAGLLVVDATSWTELARAEFRTPGSVPKCLHVVSLMANLTSLLALTRRAL